MPRPVKAVTGTIHLELSESQRVLIDSYMEEYTVFTRTAVVDEALSEFFEKRGREYPRTYGQKSGDVFQKEQKGRMGDSVGEGRNQNGVDMTLASIVTRDVTNQDEWEVYVPGIKSRKGLFFSVTSKGGVNLSRTARDLLGNPEWIAVRINRSRGLIGVIASNQGEHSLRISSNGHVSLSLLTQEMGLAHGRYALHQDGDVLVTNIATDHS